MTHAEFRKAVRRDFPHVKVSIKTVTFDGRAERSCLKCTGLRSTEEQSAINALAREAGILRDGNLYGFAFTESEVRA